MPTAPHRPCFPPYSSTAAPLSRSSLFHPPSSSPLLFRFNSHQYRCPLLFSTIPYHYLPPRHSVDYRCGHSPRILTAQPTSLRKIIHYRVVLICRQSLHFHTARAPQSIFSGNKPDLVLAVACSAGVPQHPPQLHACAHVLQNRCARLVSACMICASRSCYSRVRVNTQFLFGFAQLLVVAVIPTLCFRPSARGWGSTL